MKRENFWNGIYEKLRRSGARFALAVFGLMLAAGIVAAPALAATEEVSGSDSTAVVCEHKYGDWSIVKQAGTVSFGQKVRTCELCGKEQNMLTVSPLMLVIICAVALCIIVALAHAMSSAASKVGKFLRRFCFILSIIFIVGFFLVILVFSLNNKVKYGQALANGTVDMLFARSFAEKGLFHDICGSLAAKIMNGFFYFVILTLISGIIYLIKSIGRAAKKVGSDVKDAGKKISSDVKTFVGKD